MALRPSTLIQIEQVANPAFPNRELNTFFIDFVNSGEIVSSWANLTDTCKIVIPYNIYVLDDNNKPTNWTGKGIYATKDKTQSPLFLRNDKISVTLGYFYSGWDMEGNKLQQGQELLVTSDAPIFSGYIVKIKNRIPITLECEDEMFQMKQISCKNKIYSGKSGVKNILGKPGTVALMLRSILQDAGLLSSDNGADGLYTVTDGGTDVNVGDFRVQNETMADVLNRLKKDAHLHSWFRGKELRCSGIAYYPEDIIKQTVFAFQQNIISDTLEYTDKDDLNVAINAYAENVTFSGATNADGSPKGKKQRLEILLTKEGIKYSNVNGKITGNKELYKGSIIRFPVLSDSVITLKEITDRAKLEFQKLYYSGCHGSITTFGQPAVQHGQAAIIQDQVLKERDGTYLIKEVRTNFGMNGFRQQILLHMRIDAGQFTDAQLKAGL